MIKFYQIKLKSKLSNEYRLEIDIEEYFIDILLYHHRLQCLIVIELKIGKILPEYAEKMQFYLSGLDNLVKEKDENRFIGIIKRKNVLS